MNEVVRHIRRPATRTVLLAVSALALTAGWLDVGLCPIRQATGQPCPTCGVTSTVLNLLGLRDLGSQPPNPVAWIAIAIALQAVSVDSPGRGRYARALASRRVEYVLLAALLLAGGWHAITLRTTAILPN